MYCNSFQNLGITNIENLNQIDSVKNKNTNIENLSDYIKIITNQKTIITRETISNIEAKLPKKKFMRIHRSFLISMAKIESFTNEYVTINQKALPISRSYKKEVLEQLEGL